MLLTNIRKSLMQESSIKYLIKYKMNRCFFLFDLNPTSSAQAMERMTNALLSLFGYNSFIHSSILNLNYAKMQFVSGEIFAFFFSHSKLNYIIGKLQLLGCMDRLCGIYIYDQFFNVAHTVDLLQKTSHTIYITLFSLLYKRLCSDIFELCQSLVVSLSTIKNKC